jgi:hypothetical protein
VDDWDLALEALDDAAMEHVEMNGRKLLSLFRLGKFRRTLIA